VTLWSKCDYCGATIRWGGKRQGTRMFCSTRCLESGDPLSRSVQVPRHIVQQAVRTVHQGCCPKCGGSGPVDVHISHRVWSVVFYTRWRSQPRICCRPCGVKSQLTDAMFSLLFGWWGFPFGLVITPVQIGRNIVGAIRPPDPSEPSARLVESVRMTVVAQLLASQAGGLPSGIPPN
jgi:hypothetical protein